MVKLLKSLIKGSCIAGVASIMFSFLTAQPALAGSTISVSPASGTLSGNFYIDIVANSTGGNIAGYEVDVDLTGPITYVTGATGTLNCTPIIEKVTSTKINITCLSTFPDYLEDSGSMARLSFITTGTGTATISLDVVDTDATIDGVVNGTYTVSASGGSGTGGLPNTASDELPFGILASGIMTIVGLGALASFFFTERLTRVDEKFFTETLSEKVRKTDTSR